MVNTQFDEEYVINLVVETDEALEATKKWRADVDKVKKDLLDLRTKSKDALSDVVKGYLEAAKASATFTEETNQLKRAVSAAVREINTVDRAMDSARKEMEASETQVSSWGKIVEIAFGFSLGTIAIDALKAFINILREGIAAAGEFSMDVARLEVNLRAFQRTGGELGFSEMISFMEELRSQYKIFSEREIVEATQAAIHWGRQLDLTGEQIKELLDSSVQMSIIMGQDLTDSIRQVTTAAITGRTQSLRPYGVALDGTRIKTLAVAQGLVEVGDDLDNNTKLTIILQEIQKVLNSTMGETGEILDNLGGKQAAVSTAWQNLKKDMAEGLAPALELINDWLLILINGFNDFIDTNKRFVAAFVATIDAIKGALKGEDFFTIFERRFAELEKFFFPLKGLTGADIGAGELLPDPEDVEEVADELEDVYKKLGIRIREALIDEQEKLEEAEENHLERLNEMSLNFLHKRENARIKFGNDIAEINRKSNDELTDKNDEFRERELDKEEKFQEKLRKLREDFLLDLEDALRERDAKQVLSLIRRFNLREKQLKRQSNLDKKQRQRRFQDQIDDIRRRRDIRIREAGIEFQERRELALRDHQFRINLENQRFQQRLADIREETRLRIEELQRRFEDENAITEEGAKQVRDILQKYFGAGGEVDRIYNHLIAKTAGTLAAVSTMVTSMAQQLASIGGTPTAEAADFRKADAEMAWRDWMSSRQSGKPGFAEGGTLLAMKPTTVQFGEKEPEIATFSPLGRIGQNEGKTFVSGNAPSGGNGKVQIELLLSEDLIARTESKVLAGAAEIIIRKTR